MTPYLSATSLYRSFGGVLAVSGASFELEQGQLLSMLGPSGCGKTTILNMLAGFLHPDSGDIELAGRSVLNIAPRRRGISMMFQSLALFPHMTVSENIAYGLRIRRGLPKDAAKAKIMAMLDMVGMTGSADSLPHQLSGGQQQRVALARALAIEPKLVLLDEPLSALDAKLRQEMRDEIRGLLKRTGATAVMVTHDQAEALTMSDQIAVMNRGRIIQVGTPQEVYQQPSAYESAVFLGESVVLTGTVLRVDSSDVLVELDEPLAADISGVVGSSGHVLHVGDRVRMPIRIEDMRLATTSGDGAPAETNQLEVGVEHVHDIGAGWRYTLNPGGSLRINLTIPGELERDALEPGDQERRPVLQWARHRTRVFLWEEGSQESAL